MIFAGATCRQPKSSAEPATPRVRAGGLGQDGEAQPAEEQLLDEGRDHDDPGDEHHGFQNPGGSRLW